MGAGGITNVGPINTQTTGKGAIMGFDPIMSLSRRRTKARKKKEAAGMQWEHRRDDPTYIDGRSKQARKLIKRLTKKKKMAEELIKEDDKSSSSGGETTKQAYKFINQKRKVLKKQEREKRAQNRKKEIETISRAKSADYAKKGKERQQKLSQQLKKQNNSFEFGDGLVYLESLCELADEGKLTTFFFADETELELTQEQAYVIVDRFNQLSEEHQEKLVNMLPSSKEIMTTFMTM